MKIPTAAKVLNHARPATIAPFTDAKLIAKCEQCLAERPLSDCKIEDTEKAKNYRCPSCNDLLVIIRAPYQTSIAIPSVGYRLGEWVFASVVDVRIEGLDGGLLPAMHNATTMEIRSKGGG